MIFLKIAKLKYYHDKKKFTSVFPSDFKSALFDTSLAKPYASNFFQRLFYLTYYVVNL